MPGKVLADRLGQHSRALASCSRKAAMAVSCSARATGLPPGIQRMGSGVKTWMAHFGLSVGGRLPSARRTRGAGRDNPGAHH